MLNVVDKVLLNFLSEELKPKLEKYKIRKKESIKSEHLNTYNFSRIWLRLYKICTT